MGKVRMKWFMIYWLKYCLIILQANGSGIMGTHMKANLKIPNFMAKVERSELIYDLLIQTLFN